MTRVLLSDIYIAWEAIKRDRTLLESLVKAANMLKGLEDLCEKERLTDLGLFILAKCRQRGSQRGVVINI